MGRPLKWWPRTALAVPPQKLKKISLFSLSHAHNLLLLSFFFFFFFTKTHDTHTLSPPNFFNFHTSPSSVCFILHSFIIRLSISFIILPQKVSFLLFALCFPIRKFEISCLFLVDSVLSLGCLMMGN